MAAGVDSTPDDVSQRATELTRPRQSAGFSVPERLILWFAFLSLITLTVWGIFAYDLLHQDIWNPQGIASLSWFSAVCPSVFAFLTIALRRWFVSIVVSVTLAYTVLAVGPAALLAILLMLWAAHTAGMILLQYSRDSSTSDLDPLDDLLSIIVGIAGLIGVMNLTAHIAINYWLSWLLLLAAPIVMRPRAALLGARRAAVLLRPQAPRNLLDSVSLAILLFFCVIHWMLALKPEVSADGLAMHLVIPSMVAQTHLWPFDTSRFAWSVMPMGGDWCYSVAYLLGGEFASRLFNVSILFVASALLFHLARLRLSFAASTLIVVVLLSNPLTSLVTSSLFVENIWAALILGVVVCIWRFHFTRSVGYLYASALSLGAALATKIGALSVVPFAIAAIAWELRALPKYRRRHAAGLVVVFLACGAAPYVTAAVKTGNPVFPFLNAVFKAPGVDTAVSLVDERYHQKLSLRLWYDLTFKTSAHYEALNGAWGFHMLYLVPFALLLVRRYWAWLARISLGFAASYFVLTFRDQANLRYFYPAVPVVLIFVAEALAELSLRGRALYLAACVSIAAFLPLNLYFFGASSSWHREFVLDPVFHRASIAAYEERTAPGRNLVRRLNKDHLGAPAAFIGNTQIGELRALAYSNTWHSYEFERALRETRSALDVLRLAADRSLQFFVAPTDLTRVPGVNPSVPNLLRQFALPERTNSTLTLYRLKDEFIGERGLLAAREMKWIARKGEAYDDTAPEVVYEGRWFTGPFADASNGTLTYSDHSEASAVIRFDGSAVTYVYTAAYNRGMVEISVDGDHRTTLDLYAPSIQWQQRTTIGGLKPGQHLMELRILGRQNPASRGTFVDVDAIEIR